MFKTTATHAFRNFGFESEQCFCHHFINLAEENVVRIESQRGRSFIRSMPSAVVTRRVYGLTTRRDFTDFSSLLRRPIHMFDAFVVKRSITHRPFLKYADNITY